MKFSEDNYKNNKVISLLNNINCEIESEPTYFDPEVFREIIYEFKKIEIQEYVKFCVEEKNISRIFYFYSK